MVEYQLNDNAMWDGQVTLSCRFHDDMWRTQVWPFLSEERWMLNSVSPISYLLHHTLTCYTRACHIATTCQRSVKCSVAEQIKALLADVTLSAVTDFRPKIPRCFIHSHFYLIETQVWTWNIISCVTAALLPSGRLWTAMQFKCGSFKLKLRETYDTS